MLIERDYPTVGTRPSQEVPLGTDYRNDEQLARVVNKFFEYQAGFAAFGTLLGIVRDGMLLPDDTDIDYYVTLDRIPRLITLIRELKDDVRMVRFHETYLTLMTTHREILIDVYVALFEGRGGHRLVYAYDRDHWSIGGVEMKWNCSMTIDGRFLFLVPNNPEHCLQSWYGPTWRTRIPRKEFFKDE